ncbi:uncharacterized protein [Euwallacea fornicatus]|uniref:uncharacterized protein n=1 Tax=Euwallacea fornicatus TaxID=995702 RepID=UPI00339047B9
MAIHFTCTVILILLIQNILPSESVLCYKCVFAPYVYLINNTYLCEDFDFSEKFIVDCRYSTLCLKRNIHANIKGVQINGTERDCASQKLTTQVLSNGKWRAETRVEEPYKEGCTKHQDKGLRTAAIEHCYCRGNLCNSGHSLVNQSQPFLYHKILLYYILFSTIFRYIT